MATGTIGERNLEKLGENHFVLEIAGLPLGAFREITGLQMEREVLEYAEGGNNDFVHKLLGRVKWPNLVFKRGVTNQDELVKWFWQAREAPEPKLITVQLVDSALKPMRTWSFNDAYPVKWIGPNLNAGSDSAGTEQLEVVHAGLVMS
jgi:phage tail-like protein